jgi:hypothetical protein
MPLSEVCLASVPCANVLDHVSMRALSCSFGAVVLLLCFSCLARTSCSPSAPKVLDTYACLRLLVLALSVPHSALLRAHSALLRHHGRGSWEADT